MSKRVIGVVILACSLMLASCSLIRFTDQQALLLLPPALGHQAGVTKQDLQMQAAGRQQRFIMVSNNQPEKFQVLVMTPTGQTLLTMAYDGETFTEQNQTNIALPAREILAIMQFSAWPEAVVQQFYEADQGDWSFEAKDHYRQLRYQQKLWLDVHYDKDVILVKNIKGRYRVSIKKLEAVSFE